MNKRTEQALPTKRRKGKLGWLKELLILSAITVIIGWGIDIWRSQTMVSGPAPELLVQSVSGEQIDLLAMSEEKPVMLYFWASWCAVCNGVSPSVDFISEHYQVVTIAIRSGEAERIQKYLDGKEYNFDVVNDPQGEVSRTWGVAVTPTIFVVDKGEISSVTTGFTSPLGMWLRLLFA